MKDTKIAQTTATIRAVAPSARPAETQRDLRLAYYEYVASAPGPTIAVIQDLDHRPGVGAFWGEVQSNVHKALGLAGALTDGSRRWRGCRQAVVVNAALFHDEGEGEAGFGKGRRHRRDPIPALLSCAVPRGKARPDGPADASLLAGTPAGIGAVVAS